MKRLALCCLLLTIGLLCRSPLGAVGRTEPKDTPQPAGKTTDISKQAEENRQESTDTTQLSVEDDKKNNSIPALQGGTQTQAADALSPTADENTTGNIQAKEMPVGATQMDKDSAEAAKNDVPDSPAVGIAQAEETPAETLKSSGTALSTTDADEKKGKNSETASSTEKDDKNEKKNENSEPADVTFASIHNKGLTVADGNRWYYESFDRQGRSCFAVLYEDGTAVEKIVWTYQDASRYPVQKKVLSATESEIFRYDDAGRELSIERYAGKKLASKTENIYNRVGKLMEQTVTAGKNSDRSVWEFAGDKAVTQTKYRNGKKTAFIELHSTPHIVHLYVDDKEVYVGEEQ